MSDANRVQLSYVTESTYGTHPGGTLQILRMTGESLAPDVNYIASNELRSDRQRGDYVLNDYAASGTINGELSYSTYSDFFLQAFQASAWGSPVIVAEDDTAVAAVTSGNKFTHATGWDNNPTVGTWIKVSGFATAANNGHFKVVSRTSTEIVVSGGTLVDESAGPSVDVTQGGFIANGTTQKSMSIERYYGDLSSEYVNYLGCVIDTMALSLNEDGIITINWGILAKSEASASSSSGSGYGAATTNPVMNSITNVLAIQENLTSYGVKTFTLNLSNNLRKRKQIATLGSVSIGAGTVDVTGNITSYYTSKAIVDKLLGDTVSNIVLILQDSANSSYVFDIPQIKYTRGRRVGGGINTDVLQEMEWAGYRDATELVTIKLFRFAS